MHTRACCTVVTQWTLQLQRQSKMQAPEQICPSGPRRRKRIAAIALALRSWHGCIIGGSIEPGNP